MVRFCRSNEYTHMFPFFHIIVAYAISRHVSHLSIIVQCENVDLVEIKIFLLDDRARYKMR